jgi:hypothetical protein
VQACVGFNGTDFKAVDCAAADIKFVSLVGGQLTSGTACQSGHDGAVSSSSLICLIANTNR